MECEVERGLVSPIVFPCIMVGNVSCKHRVYFSEDFYIDNAGDWEDRSWLSESNLKQSTHAPPGTKFTITLVAGEDDCLVRSFNGSSSGKIVKYLCTPGATVQITDGIGKAPHVENYPDCACRYAALPKGTISTITFIQQSNGPCKVEYKEEEPKDWLPVKSGHASPAGVRRSMSGRGVEVFLNDKHGPYVYLSPDEYQFMADTFQRLADEHKAKENA